MIDGIEQPSLVTVISPSGQRMAAVATPDGVWRPDELAAYADVLDVVRDWDTVGPGLTELLAQGRWSADDRLDDVRPARLLAPPAKILCSGPNFTDHLAEMGESGLGPTWTAYFFFKPPTTTMRASGEAYEISSPDERADWEGELAVVMGRGGRHIPVDQALDHVAGYTVANDISLRGPHRRDTPAAPFQWDWIASKAADGSLPIGPGLVPAAMVPDPQNLSITTTVSGVVRQDGTTASMVLDVAHLISQASDLLTLEPGDIILTGTPAGVGAGKGLFLEPGDDVTVVIPGIGTLKTPITQSGPR